MRNIIWVILLVALARAQQKYKFCAPERIQEGACYSLQRGNSEVSCLRVADSAECAIRLAEGHADFGIFNAEELLLTHQFYTSEIQPILELRHEERMNENFEYQTVAVIRADLTYINLPPGERLKQLKGGGLCHPGFSKAQWWNDYILKYFENKVNPIRCQDDVTIIENEIRSLRNFFGKACRPGEWTSDASLDRELKTRYPQLCALCDDTKSCTYNNMMHHGHPGALQCLTQGDGKVAYVALSYVQEYLRTNDSFQFLCSDGSILPLSTPNPCAWIQQPWSAVAARKEISDSLKSRLSNWLKSNTDEEWILALKNVIHGHGQSVDMGKMAIDEYLKGRPIIDLGNIETCGKDIRWCTISDQETTKCKWIAKEAKALGVAPSISCVQSNTTFQCFRDISENRADIMAIDSNYGYLARTVYGLSTVLYSETDIDKNSVIIAVTREPNGDNFPVKSFFDLKGKKACFPEYGGIGWLSFIYTIRTRGVISSKSCNYPSLVADLLSGACTPGIEDTDHLRTNVESDISSKLCSACRHSNNTSCAPNATNQYFGNKGAMHCLADRAGDVAFVEAANIDENIFEPHMYRILCKNGSLANNAGYNFDEFCPLSVTIDSEVVGRKNKDKISMMNIVLTLMKLENWLGYRAIPRRPIHIYGPFNDTRDLLFKDSTSGLISTSSTKESVRAYKELFDHIDACSYNDSHKISFDITLIVLIAFYFSFID